MIFALFVWFVFEKKKKIEGYIVRLMCYAGLRHRYIEIAIAYGKLKKNIYIYIYVCMYVQKWYRMKKKKTEYEHAKRARFDTMDTNFFSNCRRLLMGSENKFI